MKKIIKNAIKIILVALAAVTIIRVTMRTEICKGICLDESGNGKVYNGERWRRSFNNRHIKPT